MGPRVRSLPGVLIEMRPVISGYLAHTVMPATWYTRPPRCRGGNVWYDIERVHLPRSISTPYVAYQHISGNRENLSQLYVANGWRKYSNIYHVIFLVNILQYMHCMNVFETSLTSMKNAGRMKKWEKSVTMD